MIRRRGGGGPVDDKDGWAERIRRKLGAQGTANSKTLTPGHNHLRPLALSCVRIALAAYEYCTIDMCWLRYMSQDGASLVRSAVFCGPLVSLRSLAICANQPIHDPMHYYKNRSHAAKALLSTTTAMPSPYDIIRDALEHDINFVMGHVFRNEEVPNSLTSLYNRGITAVNKQEVVENALKTAQEKNGDFAGERENARGAVKRLQGELARSRHEAAGLTAKMAKLETEAEGLRGEVASAKTEARDLDAMAETLRAELEVKQGKVRELEKEKADWEEHERKYWHGKKGGDKSRKGTPRGPPQAGPSA